MFVGFPLILWGEFGMHEAIQYLCDIYGLQFPTLESNPFSERNIHILDRKC